MGERIISIGQRVGVLDTRRGAPVVKRITGRPLERIRDRILLRDGYQCQVCGWVSVDLDVDHITPLHLGGHESDSNRQAICAGCHQVKSERERQKRDG